MSRAAINSQAAEQQSSRAAEQPSSRADEQPSSRAAKQQSSQAAEQPCNRTAEQPSSLRHDALERIGQMCLCVQRYRGLSIVMCYLVVLGTLAAKEAVPPARSE